MITIMWSLLIEQLQQLPDAREYQLSADSLLFQQGDKVRFLFWVVSGEIRLIRYQTDGSSLILQRAKAREYFGRGVFIFHLLSLSRPRTTAHFCL
ncbi:MAG: cyclic nucleotide-binding domain-containing protein [Thiothrix sp.]|nr:MAG: cyclic nucleotide-binding domain-containing protein [Thiothrix sp.]